MIRTAQLGLGYWGPNLLRNLIDLPAVEVVAVADPDDDRRERWHSRYPGVEFSPSGEELIARDDIEAVVIATPAVTHYSLARQALDLGKHVFVEKPLALTVAEGSELVETAGRRDAVLMVGHVFEYNAAVRTVHDLIAGGDLGDVYYINGQRLNLGRVRQDVDALWNLAPHDLSIVNRWMGEDPVEVHAHGLYRLQKGIADAVFLNLSYRDGRICHLHVSWLYPQKVRSMAVIGSRKMVVYDDTSPSAKVQIYDKGIDRTDLSVDMGEYSSFGQFQLVTRAGDVHVPEIEFVEPLRTELEDFVRAIETGHPPEADGASGLRVIRCLETASRSLLSGQPEKLT